MSEIKASTLTDAVKQNLNARKVAPTGVTGFDGEGKPITGKLSDVEPSAPNGETDLIAAVCEEVVKLLTNLKLDIQVTAGATITILPQAPLMGVGGGVPGPVTIPPVPIQATVIALASPAPGSEAAIDSLGWMK